MTKLEGCAVKSSELLVPRRADEIRTWSPNFVTPRNKKISGPRRQLGLKRPNCHLGPEFRHIYKNKNWGVIILDFEKKKFFSKKGDEIRAFYGTVRGVFEDKLQLSSHSANMTSIAKILNPTTAHVQNTSFFFC